MTAAGGRVVAIGRLVSPDFRGRPEMFYADGFHPSGPGYAKATAALLPEVVAGLRDSLDAEPASSAADPASSSGWSSELYGRSGELYGRTMLLLRAGSSQREAPESAAGPPGHPTDH